MLAGDIAVVDGLDRAAVILLDAAALAHPCKALAGQAFFHVDRHIGIGIGPGGVIQRQWRLAGTFAQRDFPHWHAQIRRHFM
jgi:hypothetical protein